MFKTQKFKMHETLWNKKGHGGFKHSRFDFSFGTSGNDILEGTSLNDVMFGFCGDDKLHGYKGNDILFGGAGNDRLVGDVGNDFLIGGCGDDDLQGDSGNDILFGGAGSDYLGGNIGNDTYIFGKGCGYDTILDKDSTAGNTDRIVLQKGICAKDIFLERCEDHLLINIKGTNDTLKVVNYFKDDSYKIEKICFANGTTWNTAKINEIVYTVMGTNGDDKLYGTIYDNTIKGLAGDDRLIGSAGNDLLEGGSGNDTLFGGVGSDTLIGGAGDDNLQGDIGNDILNGGAGNDYLGGDAGNDTYIFGRGYGQDTLLDKDSTAGNMDKILMDKGIKPEDILLRRSGDNLVIAINNSEDQLTVTKYFADSSYMVEQIEFANGTAWDSKYIQELQLNQLVQAMASYGDSNGMAMSQSIIEAQENQGLLNQFWAAPVAV